MGRRTAAPGRSVGPDTARACSDARRHRGAMRYRRMDPSPRPRSRSRHHEGGSVTGNGFNLITDPWIPVAGGPVSIEQALLDAHDIDGWPCSDPAFSEALMRLLVPMVYRITGMDDPKLSRYEFADQQRRLLEKGRLDPDRVRSYLDRHRDRFWLVHPPASQQPFAQDPTLAAVEPKPPSKLVVSWASGNNPLLGPHAPSGMLPPAEAAQQLLVQRCYASGGLHTKHPAHAGSGRFVGAALRGTTCVHPIGSSLAKTFIGHLVPLPPDTSFGQTWWEETSVEIVAPYRYRAGLLEQIAVRQDKTMLLYAAITGEITGFTISEGRGRDTALDCLDPYWLMNAEREPIKPREGRAFWREAEALLSSTDDGRRAASATILEWAADPDGGGGNYPPNAFSWAAISHRGDKSKELAWSCSHASNLLNIFEPAVAMRCLEFLAAAADAERQMAKQLAKAWHSADVMPSDPKSKNAVYAPARATFWGRCEMDFWDAARSPVDAEQRDERLREYALAGYDDATAHLLHERRSHLAVVESREWIARWRRQPDVTTDRGDVAA
ncbi:MAG: type I-E CRISPR-associated protein Cse1/CasA [Acidimicrobiales bacterium]|nr:type I-E CRISPR-associated protein Cse1/CasA [Acidimicrobiales bacterium]MYA38869.1 type I-E CRISPR-associated protein Cse1/CasA [Acidimicrobiia bacterium]MYB82805.1 type I-E CRISPR-associated protein Cse1/CasA [Acidimicrobiales bacterium]MYK55306.1 type I-E CRISPR-associated protein Cse1/CasA [Acidimicrobiia bacterium]